MTPLSPPGPVPPPQPPGGYQPPGTPGGYQPGYQNPTYQPPGSGGSGGRTGLIIGLIVGVVVLLLGCCAGAAFYLGADDELDRSRSAAKPNRTGPAASSVAQPPLDCRGATVSDPRRIKKVGLPAFERANRSGPATMVISTNLGELTIAMDRAKTPCTVASFEHLAANHFLDGTNCHRLVNEGIFVLQCGDPLGDGTGGPDYQFADENLTGARYTRGIVAMANAGPDTNGSQFFIVYREAELPADYTPFGEVRAGMSVIDQVAAAGHNDSMASSAGGGNPNLEVIFRRVTVS